MSQRPSLLHDCPNCGAENQGFEYRAGYTHARRDVEVVLRNGRTTRTPLLDFLVFSCGRCFAPVFVEIARSVSEFPGHQALALNADFSDVHGDVVSIKPRTPKIDAAPECTQKAVAGSYEQACRALRKGDADLAGMGFRKSLDVATRHLIRQLAPPDMEKIVSRSLKTRIDWLHDQRRLTADLKEYAHIIREDGNDAAHEEVPYNVDEAEALHDFARVFLMYVFTIPGMIEAKRQPPGSGG